MRQDWVSFQSQPGNKAREANPGEKEGDSHLFPGLCGEKERIKAALARCPAGILTCPSLLCARARPESIFVPVQFEGDLREAAGGLICEHLTH